MNYTDLANSVTARLLDAAEAGTFTLLEKSVSSSTTPLAAASRGLTVARLPVHAPASRRATMRSAAARGVVDVTSAVSSSVATVCSMASTRQTISRIP